MKMSLKLNWHSLNGQTSKSLLKLRTVKRQLKNALKTGRALMMHFGVAAMWPFCLL